MVLHKELQPTVTNLTNLFLKVVQGLLALRLLFKLFGANTGTGFVSWVYEMTSPLLYPLRNVLPEQAHTTNYVLEISTILAMVFYALLALVVLWAAHRVAVPAAKRR